ncbi:MAG: hypothetical protein JXR39_03210 [Marinilabiliaceae bacterium]|nr:hypothetical protein [Marinilabiliaceae bacterium]
MKKLYALLAVVAMVGAVNAQTYLFGTDANADGVFSFNNQVICDKWVSAADATFIKTISLYNSVSAEANTSLKVDKVGPGTDGVAGTAGSITGAIEIAKTITKFNYTGGSVVFELPDCNHFSMTLSATGDICAGIFTSANGTDWNSKSEPGVRLSAKGIYSYDITSLVSSTSKIWIKVVNGGTGGLNIHDVKIESTTITPAVDPGDGNSITLNDSSSALSVEYFTLTGVALGSNYEALPAGVYIQKSTYANGAVESVKISKSKK